MTRIRRLARAAMLRLAALSLGLGIAFLVLELAMRLFPVADPPAVSAVDETRPVFHFEPDQRYLWSIGWDFAVVNRGRTNDNGFINDQDYVREREQPLLAVIGDSYVEALMVPYADTLHGRLAGALAGQVQVFSLAASGAPLSQYLIWAQHARDRFRPDALAVVVVGNDFDESLAWYKTGPGFHHFIEAPGGDLKLTRIDYRPSVAGRLVRHSALARYLAFNLHAHTRALELGRALVARFDPRAQAAATSPSPPRTDPAPMPAAPRYIGNTAADADAARIADSLRALDAFLAELPARAGLPPTRIALIVDALRPQLYEGPAAVDAVRDAYFPQMRKALIERAQRAGFEVLDLHPAFATTYRQHAQRFEFETDFHWNAAGHRVVAELLERSRVLSSLGAGS